MISHIQLRVSVNALTSFLLVNLLLTGTTFAGHLKTSLTHEVRRVNPAIQPTPGRRGGTPTQKSQLFRKEAPTGIWCLETAPSRKERSVKSGSTNHKAENVAASIPKRDRVLRDISPPGMWPPGSDAPPSEYFFELTRRRALLSAADHSQRMKPRVQLIEKLASPERPLLHDISPLGMWPVSDTPASEKFGRRRSLLKASASEFREHKVPLKQGTNALPSTQSQLRDISPPGLLPVTDSPPSEFASRRLFAAGPQGRKNSQSFSSDNVHLPKLCKVKPFQKQVEGS